LNFLTNPVAKNYKEATRSVPILVEKDGISDASVEDILDNDLKPQVENAKVVVTIVEDFDDGLVLQERA